MAQRNLPLRGAANPSTAREGTTPGSFANPSSIGGPLTFSSPDTPGMPAPSDKTAWDFMPSDWVVEEGTEARRHEGTQGWHVVIDSTGVARAVHPPAGVVPV